MKPSGMQFEIYIQLWAPWADDDVRRVLLFKYIQPQMQRLLCCKKNINIQRQNVYTKKTEV